MGPRPVHFADGSKFHRSSGRTQETRRPQQAQPEGVDEEGRAGDAVKFMSVLVVCANIHVLIRPGSHKGLKTNPFYLTCEDEIANEHQ